jgi:chemotaxis protein MotA
MNLFPILGIVVVAGAIIGGYLLEKGNLLVLMQPAELLIIGGAAAGTVLIANPWHILLRLLKGISGVFKNIHLTKELHLNSLKLLYQLFDMARRAGLPAVEAEIEDPAKSKLFTAYPAILRDSAICSFVSDTFRTMLMGGVEPFDLEQMMEQDIETRHHEQSEPAAALTTVADSLPGLGIVAAVLGVVITMGALGGKPEEIGHKVAAALVGTFLGVLLCYGFIGPLAAAMAKAADAQRAYYHVLRVAIAAFSKGIPPILAVEMGRRAIPLHIRPTFQELENTCRNRAPATTEAAQAKS